MPTILYQSETGQYRITSRKLDVCPPWWEDIAYIVGVFGSSLDMGQPNVIENNELTFVGEL